jgi:hypothetical protein
MKAQTLTAWLVYKHCRVIWLKETKQERSEEKFIIDTCFWIQRCSIVHHGFGSRNTAVKKKNQLEIKCLVLSTQWFRVLT